MPDVLVAYEMNGAPLPVQHGFPARLVVPGWYGMASVKWLRRITVLDHAYEGFQNQAYRLRQAAEEVGVPVTRIEPRALLAPPGLPSSRRGTAFEPGPVRLQAGRGRDGPGRAGRGRCDDGRTWTDAALGPAEHRWA